MNVIRAEFTEVKCDGGCVTIVQYPSDEFLISIWKENSPLTWVQKIKWCWRILRNGNPQESHIIVKGREMNQVADFINHYLQNGKKTEK